MKKKNNKWLSAALAACMVLGSVPAYSWPAAVMAAEAKAQTVSDGEIDSSAAGQQTLRYATGTEITSATEKSEHLSDFFNGTKAMKWSVDFKTSVNADGASGLESLLGLATNSEYYVLYIKKGIVAFEAGRNKVIAKTTKTYNDGNWHTAELELDENGKATLRIYSIDSDGKKTLSDTIEGGTTAASNFIASWGTPSNFTIGGMVGYNSPNGWVLKGGTIKNVVLTKTVAVTQTPVFEISNPGTETVATKIAALTTGAVNVSYRLKKDSSEKTDLLTLADGAKLYLDPAAKKVGIQKTDHTAVEYEVSNTALGTEKWHTLTLMTDGINAEILVDSVSAGNKSFTDKLDVSGMTFGSGVYCSTASVYDKELGKDQISDLHSRTASDTYKDASAKLEGYHKTENRELFNSGYDGSVAYRIPAIVTSKKTGTVVASIDKRWDHSGDVGRIDSVIRRSEDGGKTWSNVIPVIDLPDADAYTVDPALVVDNKEDSPYYGRIYMLVDMYPYNIGLWGSKPGDGYKEIDGTKYRCLYDSSNNEYTVRENGYVYNSNNEKTEYQVETQAQAPYTELGSLYKNGKKIGSIYKNSELKIYETTYLWMSYSDDDGRTWSQPKDITPMVKDDWMRFSGTGPGQGVQLQNGRIVFSAYCSNSKVGSIGASALSSFHVYSDDGGETWHRGASPNDRSDTNNASNSDRQLNENSIVQLNNGHMIQFMKNATNNVAMAISTDNGANWGEVTYAEGITEPYCNLSALHYPEKIVDPRDGKAKEAIIFANPRGTHNYTTNGREGGTVRIAFVNDDDTLDWAYSKLIEENKFLYCSLTVLKNGDIGMIYEHEGYAEIGAAFTSFSPQYIMDGNAYENTPAPTAITTALTDAQGKETTELKVGTTVTADVTFSQNVFASGNVTLNVRVGDEVKEAKLVGNTEANKLRFAYKVEEGDSGKVVVTGEVNVKEGGVAETIYNVSLTDKPIVTKDVAVGNIDGLFATLPTAGMTASAGSVYAGTNEGPASNVLDGDVSTIWHSNYAGGADNTSNGGRSKHWITIALGGERMITALEYTPRTGVQNGTITEYQIEISTDGTNFTPIATGTWAKNAAVKTAEFGGAVKTSYVRLRALDTQDEWATAAEIRLVGTADLSAATDKTVLLQELLTKGGYAENEEFTELAAAVKKAQDAAADPTATAEKIAEAKNNLTQKAAEAGTVAKTNLSGLIAQAADKVKEDYTISSWAAYQEALDAAKNLSNHASNDEIIKAYSNLTAAQKKLVRTGKPAVDPEVTAKKAELKTVIDELEGLKASDYTEASWKAYKEAVDAAKEVYEKNDAALKEINDALSAVKQAKEALKASSETPDTKPSESETPDTKETETPDTKPTESETPTTRPTPDTKQTETPDTRPSEKPEETLKQGGVYEVSGLKYKITNLRKKTVTLVGSIDKKTRKTAAVKNTVKISGISFKVTAIGANALKNHKKLTKVVIGNNVTDIGKQAFAGCSKLKSIQIKAKALKSVGSKAFKGIDKKAVIKVPKAKKKAYTKKLAGKGQAKTVKIK